MAAKKPIKTVIDYKPMIAEALDLISDGSSVRKACEAVGISKAVFLRDVDGDRYARARECQAESYFDQINYQTQRCIDGELDPQVLKAIVDPLKWTACKLLPKKYGDRVGVDVSGQVGAVLDVSPAVQDFIKGFNNNG